MRYYLAGKKCKLDSVWTGPYLVVALLGWTVGIQKHPDVPVILIHCQDVNKIAKPCGVQSWIVGPPPVGAPAVPMLGASTVAHTSRGSPSITALPPDEGVVLEDVDSVREGRSYSQDCGSGHASAPSTDTRMAPRMDSVLPMDTSLATTALRIDGACILHKCAQVGCRPRSFDDYCACVQQPDGCLARWREIGCSCWTFTEGGGTLPFGLRHFLGPTSGRDVSNCVHHGVRIAVFSGGVGELAWHIAECIFGM